MIKGRSMQLSQEHRDIRTNFWCLELMVPAIATGRNRDTGLDIQIGRRAASIIQELPLSRCLLLCLCLSSASGKNCILRTRWNQQRSFMGQCVYAATMLRTVVWYAAWAFRWFLDLGIFELASVEKHEAQSSTNQANEYKYRTIPFCCRYCPNSTDDQPPQSIQNQSCIQPTNPSTCSLLPPSSLSSPSFPTLNQLRSYMQAQTTPLSLL